MTWRITLTFELDDELYQYYKEDLADLMTEVEKMYDAEKAQLQCQEL